MKGVEIAAATFGGLAMTLTSIASELERGILGFA